MGFLDRCDYTPLNRVISMLLPERYFKQRSWTRNHVPRNPRERKNDMTPREHTNNWSPENRNIIKSKLSMVALIIVIVHIIVMLKKRTINLAIVTIASLLSFLEVPTNYDRHFWKQKKKKLMLAKIFNIKGGEKWTLCQLGGHGSTRSELICTPRPLFWICSPFRTLPMIPLTRRFMLWKYHSTYCKNDKGLGKRGQEMDTRNG